MRFPEVGFDNHDKECYNADMGNKECVITKWQEVLEDVREQLAGGAFSVGESFLSLEEICGKYGVSNTTAKKVFEELKREGWINPVRRKGTVVSRSSTVREIVYITHSDLSSPNVLDPSVWWCAYRRVMEGLKDKEVFCNARISEIGHKFFFAHLREFEDMDVVMSEVIIDHLIHGDAASRKVLDFLRTAIRPVITHATTEMVNDRFICVGTDYKKGMGKAVEHLIAAGHKRIAYLTNSLDQTSAHWRFHGYMEALKNASLPVALELAKTTDGYNYDQDRSALANLLALPKPPTAVACSNDGRALHVLEYCRHKGIRIPDDLAVIGFDNRDETLFSHPPLSTVDSRLREQGAKALELIMKRAAGELADRVAVELEPRLVVRQST